MKTSRFFTVLGALLISYSAFANIAKPHVVEYTQPDGTVISIILHGDEYGHYATTPDGTMLYSHPDGFYRTTPAQSTSANQAPRMNRANSAVGNTSLALGQHRFLVILVAFKDVPFTISNPVQAFHNLLNQRGYSSNSATGSVYDFYYENSNGLFDPTFDVYGPVTLSQNVSAYGGNSGGNDKNPDVGFAEACQLLDPEVDFSIYDQDNDGYIDNIFFYYAGYNEAEGGPANTIWPHQWSLEYYHSNVRVDGKRLGSYACTSEYSGSSGKRMCGIGTFSHEFGHVLGLPDFYDTDYTTNGECDPLGNFSPMDSGSYNNDGRTPPYFSAYERWSLGWMDAPTDLVYTGKYTLPAIRNNKAYMFSTPNSGEYFIIETRDNYGWDKYLSGNGMLVYHVDQSKNRVSGNYTAEYLWNYTNSINAYSSHPCYRIIPARSSSYSYGSWPFPGTGNVRTYTPKAWSGKTFEVEFSEISYSSGEVSFKFKGEDGDVLASNNISYINYIDSTHYELVPGNDLTVQNVNWRTENNTLIADVTYTDGSTEIIELEL